MYWSKNIQDAAQEAYDARNLDDQKPSTKELEQKALHLLKRIVDAQGDVTESSMRFRRLLTAAEKLTTGAPNR